MQLIKTILVAVLTLESRLILRKYKPFIVAVTGSVGKTSTKDAIYCVLKDQSKLVRKSEKSMNSEIGLPLTIIGMPNAWHSLEGWLKNLTHGLSLILWKNEYPDCLILEIGADHPNDIKKVAKWLKPDVAVMTKISRLPVHVEFFRSAEEVFEEKAALAMAVKNGGTLILAADDNKVMSLAGRVKEKNIQVISYGKSDMSTIQGLDGATDYNAITKAPIGFGFTIKSGGDSIPVKIKNVAGETYMYPLLAAAAVAKARNLSVESIGKSLSEYEAPKGRMNLIAGINGSTIIDDTYNSSPDAASSALATLKSLQCSGTKIAVLGDMMELGKFSAEAHRQIGQECLGSADYLITVGPRSNMTAEEAQKSSLSSSMIHSFDTSSEAAAFIVPEVKTGDIVLVKGSQSMRMERVVKALLKEPEKVDKLLVRQEKEWLEKA